MRISAFFSFLVAFCSVSGPGFHSWPLHCVLPPVKDFEFKAL